MISSVTKRRFEEACAFYKSVGVDAQKAIAKVKNIPVSINCWQGDDVKGFLDPEAPLSGGILATGGYPGVAHTPDQLRGDVEQVLKHLPGNHRFNLHAIYADVDHKIDFNEVEPKHFAKWVAWAKRNNLKLDFNPTLFSNPMYQNGFTLSHPDEKVRNYWIKHCQNSLRIAEYFGRELGKCVNNIWIPDGYKDFPVDRLTPRLRLKDSLDKIFSVGYDSKLVLNTMESKLFGIGVEAYTVGSNEFYLSYAVANKVGLCMDDGHFHPTETVSNKISTVMCFIDEMLLHVTRPMRWDSDHVVSLDDETQEIMNDIIRNNLENRVHIALDFFDASINRVAAWIIGSRNVVKALLRACLEPTKRLIDAECAFDFTSRLAIMEEAKTYPWEDVWAYYCESENVAVHDEWLADVKQYEKDVLLKR